MNKTLVFIFGFSIGAVVGSAVTWKVLKSKCEYDSEGEDCTITLEDLKRKNSQENTSNTEPEEPVKEEVVTDIRALASDIQKNMMKTDYTHKEPEKLEVQPVGKKPYVISPDEFADLDDYEVETLFYFADGVLTDSDYTPIEDVEGMVGSNALNHFGDYEDDSVFVRNENYKTDYEILSRLDKFYALKIRASETVKDE